MLSGLVGTYLDDACAHLLGGIGGADAHVLEERVGLILGEDGDRLIIGAGKAYARPYRDSGCQNKLHRFHSVPPSCFALHRCSVQRPIAESIAHGSRSLTAGAGEKEKLHKFELHRFKRRKRSNGISADAEISRAVSSDLIDLNQASCGLHFVSSCLADHR